VLDTGVVSFLISGFCGAGAGALTVGGMLGAATGLKDFSGSSSRRLFHMLPPSSCEYEYVTHGAAF
jgi:hypothetical protein